MTKGKLLIIGLFVLAALARLPDVVRPINKGSWRESDLGSISRNFYREDMNPLYPRVDWRGDGPGYAEMEFPLYPYVTALTYQFFGEHAQINRLWAYIFSLLSVYLFFRLAREYLSPSGSAIALAFFAFSPLAIEQSTAIQPEGLMLCFYIAAFYFFGRWLKTDSTRDFVFAVAATALTILAKATAAHIGFVFGVLLIEKFGFELFKQRKIWIFGVLSVLPGALWYLHGKNLWTEFGNSLGVSNEYHWIGKDFFTNSDFLTGIFHLEFAYIWLGFGVVAGIFAIWRGVFDRVVWHSLLLYASAFIFYIVAARTTSENWAYYYHIFSLVPAGLLFGAGFEKVKEYAREFFESWEDRPGFQKLTGLTAISLVAFSITATLLIEVKQARANILYHRVDDSAFVWAESIKDDLEPDSLIIASGGHCYNKDGYQLAYNSSYFFYWLDHKGWNVCVEDQSKEKIVGLAARGARYFVAERSMLKLKPGFENDLRARYKVLNETEEFLLFDLTGKARQYKTAF